MKRLRLCACLTFTWFVLVAGLGHLHQAFALSTLGLLFVCVGALSQVLLPGLARRSAVSTVAVAVAGFVALRAVIGTDVFDTASLQVAAECVTIAVTLLLARWTSSHLASFEEAVRQTMVSHLPAAPAHFDASQGEIYAEVRRARSFDRPVSLLAISTGDVGPRELAQLMVQMQRENGERFVRAQLGGLLTEELRDYDIVAIRDDHFVTLLPETRAEQATDLVERLRTACAERLGLDLRIGISSFPEQEVTYEKLLETASAAMRAEPTDALPTEEEEELEAVLAYDAPRHTASSAAGASD